MKKKEYRHHDGPRSKKNNRPSLLPSRVIFHKNWIADYELLMIFCCCRFRDGCMRACFFSAGSEPVWKLDFRRGNISYFRNTERDILHFLVSSDLTTYSIQTRARDIFEN